MKYPILFLMLLLLPLPLTGETRSLEEIILLAREKNPLILASENDLLSAEEDLVGPILIENSAFTLKSDLSLTEPVRSPGDNSTPDRLSGSLALTIPVIDQLNLSASLDSDQKVSAGLTLKPLNMTTNQVSSLVKWDNAQNSLTLNINTLDWEVLIKILTLSASEQEKKLYEALEGLENEKYQASHALYQAGEASYEDYLNSMDNLTNAEENTLNSAEALQKASKDLWVFLGMSDSYDLEPVSLERAVSLASRLEDLVESLNEKESFSPGVKTAQNALLLAEKTWNTTLKFHPDLSVSANVNGSLDGSSAIKSTLSVNLVLSGDSFKGTKKTILEREKEEKELALSQAFFESRLERESLLSTLALARKALDLALREAERSRILTGETDILYERGERTVLEKREAALALEQSELRIYERSLSLIKAAADYLFLFPDLSLNVLDLLD